MQQTLPSITSPLDSIAKLGVALPSTSLALWLFAVVVFFWSIYTLIAGYHWFRYSHASWVAIPSLTVHMIVSVILILFALSGLVL